MSDQLDTSELVNCLVRAMIPHVRYDANDELEMAREASRAQSDNAKDALSLLLRAGILGPQSGFAESALNEYRGMVNRRWAVNL